MFPQATGLEGGGQLEANFDLAFVFFMPKLPCM